MSYDKFPTNPTHWTTLDELRGDPDVQRLKGEEFFEKPERFFDADKTAMEDGGRRPGMLLETAGFVELAVKNNGGSQREVSRRDFLKLSAAAMAFATAGCALRPTEKIIPYVKAPADAVPGVASYYATTLGDAAGTGVLVKTREGRPIKIEGNPDHPLSQGKLSAAGQVSIFNLYDPDRLQNPIKLTPGTPTATAISWPTADDEIAAALKSSRGRTVLLTGTIHGPARTRLISEFCESFGGRHVTFDAWNFDATHAAQEACYGTHVLPRYRFEQAEYFLFFDCDPLGSGYSALEWSVGFGKTRKVRDGQISKAVMFEPHMTFTGSNADQRYRVRSANLFKVALAILDELVNAGHVPASINTGMIRPAVGPWSAEAVEQRLGLPSGTIANIADDLWEYRGRGIVMAGEDKSLQIAVNLINTICGNEGRTIDGTVSPSLQGRGSLTEMLALIEEMKSGKVDTLIIWGSNPVFWLPESAGAAEALKNVKTIVSLGDRVDETARFGHYILPGLHYLESWGDAEPHVGLYSLTQPSILPLYDNRAAEDSLLSFAKAAAAGELGAFAGGWHEYLMDTWEKRVYSSATYTAAFPQFWNSALRDGVLNTVVNESAPRDFRSEALAKLRAADSASGDLELVIYPSPLLTDGQHNNNAWLLECPDPVSRITWTNYASLSPATAERLGLHDGDSVRLEANGIAAELPVQVQPGNCDDVIAVQAGWGRTAAGKIGNDVGVNALAFGKIENDHRITRGIPCTITATGKHDRLPCVQGHNYIEGRPIIADASIEEYRADHQAGHPHKHDVFSIWPEHPYNGNRWGMSIDLSSCIGCNACITACQVENNIPVVGKENIIRGREMHWIRVDRYYSGEADNPEVTYQPMLCQHCENAPCETVCPVVATVHNEEGLNQQIYNRCVGTRYCSNNCPYKVRRFNWHEYSLTAYNEHPLQLVLNPDITVREKGVMEKCTFCVQRIREGKGKAKQMGREVRDEDIVTACQQTCPTDAITFGNINNPDSQAAQAMGDERSYRVLDFIGVKPSIAYQTKLRNRPPRARSDHHDGEGHHA